MSQKTRDMLRDCPYNLSRLENLTGNLEEVTGEELAGMFSLASNTSKYKDLWLHRRVEGAMTEETLLSLAGSHDCTSSHTISENLHQKDVARVASPFTDPSPSPPPRLTHQTFLPNRVTYRYYRLNFAGLDLPILAVGYFHPEQTSKRICAYGGSRNGERCFLTSWE